MKAHCLQHISFEGMGAIETWLGKNLFKISYTRFYESAILPEVNDIDWIIVMGGPMSVNDEQEYPWLVAEKEFIRNCIAANKVVVGICLGAQLISSALGGKIYKNKEKEIGWFPIKKSQTSISALVKNFPDKLMVFHWHGETFDLPKNAELIASSDVCKNQVFVLGNRTVGFQCHLETTAQSLQSLIDHCKSELVPAKFIQTEKEMIKKEAIYTAEMHEVLFKTLDMLLSQ